MVNCVLDKIEGTVTKWAAQISDMMLHKVEQKKHCRFQYPDRPMDKTIDPKNFRDSQGKIFVRLLLFILFIHFPHFSACLFSCNWFFRYIIFMKLNWNVSSMDTLLQITLKNDYSEAFQFHKALVYLINSGIPWKIFFGKKCFSLPTHWQKSLKNTGNDNIFLFCLSIKIEKKSVDPTSNIIPYSWQDLRTRTLSLTQWGVHRVYWGVSWV